MAFNQLLEISARVRLTVAGNAILLLVNLETTREINMKTLLSVVLTVLISLNLAIAQAEPVVVPATEVAKLLTGNTIKGIWYGEEYKQYFMADGVTIYAPKKSQSTRGKWRVNAKKNAYESWWERSGWSGYKMVRDKGALFWLQESGKNQPFEILQGEQLVWPQN